MSAYSKCIHCFDHDARTDGFCSNWCRDASALEQMRITKLSRDPAPAPSRDLSAQVAAIASGDLPLDKVIIGASCQHPGCLRGALPDGSCYLHRDIEGLL